MTVRDTAVEQRQDARAEDKAFLPPTLLRCLALATLLTLALAQPRLAAAHGDVHLRILALTQQIQAATNNPARLYLERGELEREHGLWEAAGADYDRAAQFDPSLPGLALGRGKLQADRGQLTAARATLDHEVQRNPDNGECFVARARVLLKLGERQAAIADFSRGLELIREPQPECVLEFARVLEAEGHIDQALRALDDGIRKLGPIVQLQSYAIDLEVRRADYDAALARIGTILPQASRQASWLARRGDILLEAGRSSDARSSYEAARAALNRLPGRLQQSPGMVKLQAHVNTALAGITNMPVSAELK